MTTVQLQPRKRFLAATQVVLIGLIVVTSCVLYFLLQSLQTEIMLRELGDFYATNWFLWNPNIVLSVGLTISLFFAFHFMRQYRSDRELRLAFQRIESANQQVQQSEEKYRLLFENSHSAIMIMDEIGFIDCNPATLQLFGCASREKFLGKHPSEVSPPQQPDGADSRVAADERIAEAFRDGGNLFPWTHRRSNGENFTAEVLLTPMEWKGRGVIQATVRDTSKMIRMEEQAHQLQKMEMVGTLAGGIAHDLNNNLTAVMSNLSMIHEQIGEDHPAAIYVEEIKTLAECSATLTHRLLAFSRRQVLQPVLTNLDDVVARVMRSLRRQANEKIHVDLEFASAHVMVRVDVNQMEQVLLGICENARDAMPGGGRLRLAVRRLDPADKNPADKNPAERPAERLADGAAEAPGRYAAIEITDTGCGIKPELLQRVFEPFFTTKEQKAGLGLSMAYGVVIQHGGNILVTSDPERGGSTFTILLPIVDGDRATPAESSVIQQSALPVASPMTPSGLSSGGQKTILVAEDEEVVARGVRRILERLGYKVLMARDGAEAVDIFQREEAMVDLVMLDVMMPRMNGRKAFEQMARMRPDGKFLFTSGYAANVGVVDDSLMIPPGVHFIQKPYAAADLAQAVKTALATPAAA